MAIAGGYKRYLSNVLTAEKEKHDKRLEEKMTAKKTGYQRERRPDIQRYTVPARRMAGEVEKEVKTSATPVATSCTTTETVFMTTSATPSTTSTTTSTTFATTSKASLATTSTASLATASTSLERASTSSLETSPTPPLEMVSITSSATMTITCTSLATVSMTTASMTPLSTSCMTTGSMTSLSTSSLGTVSTTRVVRASTTPTPEVKQVMLCVKKRLYSDKTIPEETSTEDEFIELATFLGASRPDGIHLLQAVTDPSLQTQSEISMSVAVLILTACQNAKTVKDCTDLYFSICKREMDKQKTNNCSRFRFGHMVSRQCFQIAKNSSLVLHSHCVKHLLSFLISVYRISHQLHDSPVLCRVLATAIHQFISTALKHTDTELFLILAEYVVHESLGSELEADLPVSLCVQLQDLKQKLTDLYHDNYMLLESSRPES